MPKEDDIGTEQPSREPKILRANNVEIPVTAQPQALSAAENAELLKLRSAFFAGEKLEPAQLNKMMMMSIEGGGGGNGNCGIC